MTSSERPSRDCPGRPLRYVRGVRSPSGALVALSAVAVTTLAGGLTGCGGSDPSRAAAQTLPGTTAATVAAGSAGALGVTSSPATPGSGTVTPAKAAAPGKAPAAKGPAAKASAAKAPAAKAGVAKPAGAAPATFGNPAGRAPVPAEARAVDTSHPARVVGTGTPASCTSAAVVAAVAKGGIIRFRCGAKPVTITLTRTAKVVNTSARVVIDGGGLVTLSGGGRRRILYMDTCDPAQVYTTSHCQDQQTPQLVVQNITFADGNSTGQLEEGGGGGAILDRGGRLKIVNARFVSNRCDGTGPDLGGAAVRALSQSKGLPVYVVRSTFEKGACSNGGALSSIGVSWTVLNSVFRDNSAIGRGANPAQAGSSGGGSGGAIYNDGNTMTLRIAGTVIERNHANEGGGAVIYVSNDRTGTMRIENSVLRHNRSDRFDTAGFPGIFYLGATAAPIVVGPRPR